MKKIDLKVPDGVCGNWRIESFEVSKEDASFANLRARIKGTNFLSISPGTYKRLMRGNTVVMSNTPMEIRTNSEFMEVAKGKVLINGLGLGMVLQEILAKPEVTSVTVVEKSEDVIKLVGPTFQDDPKLTIVHADALEYKPPKGERYDCVWHDIWDNITADNLADMKKLHRKYGRICDWQGSWARSQCERQNRMSPGW